MASVAAATGSIISAISSITMPDGQAHDGIMSVPSDGTWNLKKGERVTTANTSARLDATLDRVESGQQSRGTVVNIHNAPQGTTAEQSTGPSGEDIIDIWLADFNQDGKTAQAVFRRTGTGANGI